MAESVTRPLVSVVVRTLDRPKLLKEALASIADQDYRPLEVVVVNDGGAPVGAVLDSFRHRVQLKCVNHERPRGRAAAANAGIAAATGEWVAFLDDDDLYLAGHISALIAAAKAQDAGFVYSGCRLEYDDETPAEIFWRPFDPDLLLIANFIPTCAVAVRKDLLLEVSGFDETLDFLEDWDLWLRLAQRARLVFTPEITSVYRVRPGTVAGEMASERWAAMERLFAKHWPAMSPSLLVRRLRQLEQDVASWRARSLRAEKLLGSGEKSDGLSAESDSRAKPSWRGWWQRRRGLRGPGRGGTLDSSGRAVNPLGRFLNRVTLPFPKAATALYYTRHPALLAAKAVRFVRRDARRRQYERALASGRLVVEAAGAPSEDLFTIATPVYRVSERHLRAAIASVRAQSHGHWELILLDDASPDPHIARVLTEASASDPRIRSVRRDSNAGIAVATNQILDLARGGWIAFLDHDDLLHPRALELVARFLAANPETDWVFTDEDKIDERGRHSEPCLKPGWSPHLLLSFNYVCHLRVVRTAMLRAVGKHRLGFDGAQDYDLALQVLAHGGRFRHLPGILYHWRTVHGSMARAAAFKPAAHRHALQALSDFAATFPGDGAITAEVLLAPASFFHVRRQAPIAGRVAWVLPLDCRFPPSHEAGGRPTVVALHSPAPTIGEVIAGARRAEATYVLLPTSRGFQPAEVEELLALLQVPGTAAAAARHVHKGCVHSSGFVITSGSGVWDPWFGLPLHDPGYLNLAMVPGPRTLLPARGWAARRDMLLDAWDAATDAPDEWRLAVGLSRRGWDAVVTPRVSVPALPIVPPSMPPPPELPRRVQGWAFELGLANGPISQENS